MNTKKILASAMLIGSLAALNFPSAQATEKLMIPLGKSVSIPAYGVKKILTVKDNVIDVLNVSDEEIILSGIGETGDSTQVILWDLTGKRIYDVETYSEENIIQEKFTTLVNNQNITLKIFPDSAYLQGQASSKEEKKRAEAVAKSLIGKKQLVSLIEFEGAVSSLQQRIEAAIKLPDVKVSVISSKIDPNEITPSSIIATETNDIRVILQGTVKNQNDYIHMTEIVKGFVSSAEQISNLVTITDPYQVLFQAYILQVTKKDSNDLGITWGAGTDEGVAQGVLNFIELGDAAGNAILPKDMNPFFGKNINRLSRVEAQVKAWEESGKAKVISKPNLMVYASAVPQNKALSGWGGENGEKQAISDQGLAFVEVGQTVQVEKDAGNNKTSYEPFEAKLKLCIRDLYIDEDNELKFSVFAQQEELSFERGNGSIPDKHTRSIMTTLKVKDQSTIALGGLISNNRSETWSGVPGLSKLPLVGRFFKHKSVSNTENELIILLTPKITNKETDLANNTKFETVEVPQRNDRLEKLHKVFDRIKSSHTPAEEK